MRVLHLTSTLASAGAETMLVVLASADSSNTHIVCSIYGGGAYKSRLEQLGIRVCSLDIASSIFIPFAFIKFFYIVLREKPDVIHSYLFLDNIIARIVGRLAGKKVLCSKRDSDRWKPWFVSVFNKLTSWLADATVTNFKGGINELKTDGVSVNKIFYIPNGKNASDYTPRISKNSAKKQLQFKEGDFILSYTARLVWYKGHEYLIRAFPGILKRCPNARLLISGDGKERKSLEQLVISLSMGGRVIFLGTRKDIPLILAATDIFVSPSLRDGMPGVIMEAMAAGLPVVATDADGSRDLIKNNENGILIQIRDSNAITEKITWLIANKPLADKLGKNAQQTIAKDFTVGKMVQGYQGLYRSLAGRA